MAEGTQRGLRHPTRRRAPKAIVTVAALALLALLLAAGCGGGGSSGGSGGDGGTSASTDASGADTSGQDASSSDSSDPDAAVVVKGCPDAAAMGRAVGFPVKILDLGEGDCAYFLKGQANPGISIQVVHPHDAFPEMTTLAETRKHSRFGGGTAEVESTDVGGAHGSSYLEDTPQYGPETFRAGESIEGKNDAEVMQTCDYFVLGTDGYPASVQAEAQKGGVYSYEGEDKSRDEVCEWATAALELAIR
jgi:hypothetical protein